MSGARDRPSRIELEGHDVRVIGAWQEIGDPFLGNERVFRWHDSHRRSLDFQVPFLKLLDANPIGIVYDRPKVLDRRKKGSAVGWDRTKRSKAPWRLEEI